MAFTKIAAAGIGSTETVTLHSLEVLNNATVGGVLTYEDVTNVDSIGIITARAGVLVGSGITLSKDGDIFATGVTTATKFVGDGSELTGITQTSINNNADNRLITGSDTANTLEGESTLTYGGTELLISNASPSVKLNDTDNSGVVDINNVGGAAVVQSTGDTVFETNSGERLRIHADGEVEIKQAAAGQTVLSAVGNYSSSSNVDIATFARSGGAVSSAIRYADATTSMLVGTTTSHKFGVMTGGTERLSVLSNGKVVVGNNSGGANLSVTGNLITDDGTNGRITLQADGTSTNQILSTTTGFGSYCNMKYQASNHIFLYGGTERARVRSDGGITFGGDTADANALDDYEEGTWTPDWRGASALGTTTYGSYNVASYVKIGNQVTVRGYSELNGSSGGSGFWFINNLPFLVGGGDDRRYRSVGSVMIENYNLPDNVLDVVLYVERNNNDAQLRGIVDNATSSANISVNNDDNFEIYFTVTYPTV